MSGTKWSNGRKERTFDADESRTYCRIATALQRTIEIQDEIDALYPQVEDGMMGIE